MDPVVVRLPVIVSTFRPLLALMVAPLLMVRLLTVKLLDKTGSLEVLGMIRLSPLELMLFSN